MQIVIDISEDDLDAIKFLKVKGWASRHELLILNGTPLDEVLDKIRDEMQKGKENIHFDLNEQKAKWVNSDIYDGLTWAQDIIDKYRKEQE